jgi:hypothetical protein
MIAQGEAVDRCLESKKEKHLRTLKIRERRDSKSTNRERPGTYEKIHKGQS